MWDYRIYNLAHYLHLTLNRINLFSFLPKKCICKQAEEDNDDGDEQWDPDSEMDIDDERYFAYPF